jgi:hypothetical protein
MSGMPNMRLASTGTIIRYVMRDPKDHNEAGAIAEFTYNDVSLRFLFNVPNPHEYRQNLLKFISILAYLRDVYTVSMCDIYGYVIDALKQDDCITMRQSSGVDNLAKERMDALNRVNVSLSHELSLRNARTKEADKKLACYKSFSEEIIQRLVQRSGKEISEGRDVLCALGIDVRLSNEIVLMISGETAETASEGDGHG